MVRRWFEPATGRIGGLVGRRVTAWRGVEMAIHEHPVRWTDPRCPCLQVDPLQVHFVDGSAEFFAEQDDAFHGLGLRDPSVELPSATAAPTGIFRESVLDLPLGEIRGAKVHRGDDLVDTRDVHPAYDLLTEIRLTIDERRLLLVAGEIHPTLDDQVVFARGDESVLVFTDPADADDLPWRPPRSPRR